MRAGTQSIAEGLRDMQLQQEARVVIRSALQDPELNETALQRHRQKMLLQKVKGAASGEDEARVCSVSVRILTLMDIDMTDNEFKVELILFLLWDDASLKPDAPVDWASAWHPHVTVANLKKVEDDYFSREINTSPKLIKLHDWDHHKVLHSRKFLFTIAQAYELKRFPFDMQKLQLIFKPTEHSKAVVLQPMPDEYLNAFRIQISAMVGSMVRSH